MVIPKCAYNCPGTMAHTAFYTRPELGGPTKTKDGSLIRFTAPFHVMFDVMSDLLCAEVRLGIDGRHAVPFVGGNITATSGVYVGFTGPSSGALFTELQSLVGPRPLTFGLDLTAKSYVLSEAVWSVMMEKMVFAQSQLESLIEKECHKAVSRWYMQRLVWEHISKIETVFETQYTYPIRLADDTTWEDVLAAPNPRDLLVLGTTADLQELWAAVSIGMGVRSSARRRFIPRLHSKTTLRSPTRRILVRRRSLARPHANTDWCIFQNIFVRYL